MSADTPPATLIQIKNALRSATTGIISLDGSLVTTAHDKDEIRQIIKNFSSNSSVSKYIALTSHSLHAQHDEITEIKSNITALLKMVNSLHQKANAPPKQAPHVPPKARGTDNNPTPPTYAHVASGRPS
jgi:archaellum biogenesis ATPase FlaH